jgi:hypothetical protein
VQLSSTLCNATHQQFVAMIKRIIIYKSLKHLSQPVDITQHHPPLQQVVVAAAMGLLKPKSIESLVDIPVLSYSNIEL